MSTPPALSGNQLKYVFYNYSNYYNYFSSLVQFFKKSIGNKTQEFFLFVTSQAFSRNYGRWSPPLLWLRIFSPFLPAHADVPHLHSNAYQEDWWLFISLCLQHLLLWYDLDAASQMKKIAPTNVINPIVWKTRQNMHEPSRLLLKWRPPGRNAINPYLGSSRLTVWWHYQPPIENATCHCPRLITSAWGADVRGSLLKRTEHMQLTTPASKVRVFKHYQVRQ